MFWVSKSEYLNEKIFYEAAVSIISIALVWLGRMVVWDEQTRFIASQTKAMEIIDTAALVWYYRRFKRQ